MQLAYLDESQNEAFDYEYHSEEELAAKLNYVRGSFAQGPSSLLDVGGGNGKFMDRLLEEFPRAQGYVVDISSSLLQKNRQHPRKHLVHGSLEHLPALTAGATFDVITINWVLHHLVATTYERSLKNVEQFLASAADLLNPGGTILIAENEFQGFFDTNIPSHMIYAVTRVQHPSFVRLARRYFNTAGVGVCFQSLRGWERLFARCGFQIDYYHQHARWQHGLKKRLMFAPLFLREQRHGHFAVRRAAAAQAAHQVRSN